MDNVVLGNDEDDDQNFTVAVAVGNALQSISEKSEYYAKAAKAGLIDEAMNGITVVVKATAKLNEIVNLWKDNHLKRETLIQEIQKICAALRDITYKQAMAINDSNDKKDKTSDFGVGSGPADKAELTPAGGTVDW